MKKVLFIISITIILFLKQNVYAQEGIPKNVITFNFFRILVSQYYLSYERAIDNKFSTHLTVGYMIKEDSKEPYFDPYYYNPSSYDTKTAGFLLKAEFRFHFKQQAPAGFYVGPFFMFQMSTNDLYDKSEPNYYSPYPVKLNVSYIEKVYSIGGGVLLGYKFISDFLTIDFFMGPQFISRINKITFDDNDVSEYDYQRKYGNINELEKTFFDMNAFRFGVNIGAAF